MAEKCYDPNNSPFLLYDNVPDDTDYTCEDFKSLRAKMSCGHTVTPSSLTNWCHIMLEEGRSSFECGNCRRKWPYLEVRKMALLTQAEREEFETTMSLNAVKYTIDSKKCPGCNYTVARKNLSRLSVRCRICSVNKNRVFEFCWQCLKEWKGDHSRTDRCENAGCSNESLKMLQKCKDIVFQSVKGVTGCPSVRACPTCGSLVEHSSTGCKNITCRRCKVEFCFVCLNRTVECSKTSNYTKPCSRNVAPRQTSIPVWRK